MMTQLVYQIPNDRRYWVVRAEGGDYFQHFSQFGVVAIGHLDDLGVSFSDGALNPEWSQLYEAFQQKASVEEQSSRQAATRFNQVRRFLDEIRVGDWVVTVGLSAVRVGQVSSGAFYESSPLLLRGVGESEIPMPYKLRRSVLWGPSVKKDRLSAPLLRTLRANQTVFNADALWEDICHSVLPVFERDENLYFTIRINSQDRIRSIDVSNVLSFLNELEVIAKEHERLSVLPAFFDETFADYEAENLLSLTTEAEFHSPGEIWGMISGLVPSSLGWGSVFLLGYSMLFGNSKLGFDGLVDIETRKKIWDLIIERYKLRRIEKAVDRMETSRPSADVANLVIPPLPSRVKEEHATQQRVEADWERQESESNSDEWD